MADTKAAKEVAALEAFFAMLGNDSSRAFYGPGHVVAAVEQGAVSKLLLVDSLYRCTHILQIASASVEAEGLLHAWTCGLCTHLACCAGR